MTYPLYGISYQKKKEINQMIGEVQGCGDPNLVTTYHIRVWVNMAWSLAIYEPVPGLFHDRKISLFTSNANQFALAGPSLPSDLKT